MKKSFCLLFLGIFAAYIFNFVRKLGFLTELKPFPSEPNCQYHE